jgi:hypothetical protein
MKSGTLLISPVDDAAAHLVVEVAYLSGELIEGFFHKPTAHTLIGVGGIWISKVGVEKHIVSQARCKSLVAVVEVEPAFAPKKLMLVLGLEVGIDGRILEENIGVYL